MTPSAVNQLPQPLHDAISTSYNDGLTPIFLLLIPLVVAAALLLVPVHEDTLKETIE